MCTRKKKLSTHAPVKEQICAKIATNLNKNIVEKTNPKPVTIQNQRISSSKKFGVVVPNDRGSDFFEVGQKFSNCHRIANSNRNLMLVPVHRYRFVGFFSPRKLWLPPSIMSSSIMSMLEPL